ncbi:MAG: 16S rRNA (cytosine(1402)-N(4))-methyltransferase RsmH [Thermodesulfobacteriota bacterium]
MWYGHTPVMLNEAVDSLNCGKGMVIVDCTIGGAGHSRLIAGRILPGGLLIGIDRDEDALMTARQKLQDWKPKDVCLVHDNFSNLPFILQEAGVEAVDGVLLDLGVSLHQLQGSGRGFSFNRDEPLDMRMDVRQPLTADAIVNHDSEARLAGIFREFGEERFATKIARELVRVRRTEAISSSTQLARIVEKAYPAGSRRSLKIHPATRVFMALRIAVNGELDNLKKFLAGVADCLKTNARLCVITFHSLEDRIVKRQMRLWETACVCPPDFPVCCCNKKKEFRVITRRAMAPGREELAANPMARSARLRVAEKI